MLDLEYLTSDMTEEEYLQKVNKHILLLKHHCEKLEKEVEKLEKELDSHHLED